MENNKRTMKRLEKFLSELSFGQIEKIRGYMLKRYNVYCGSTNDFKQAKNDIKRAINNHMPGEDVLEELTEVLLYQ